MSTHQPLKIWDSIDLSFFGYEKGSKINVIVNPASGFYTAWKNALRDDDLASLAKLITEISSGATVISDKQSCYILLDGSIDSLIKLLDIERSILLIVIRCVYHRSATRSLDAGRSFKSVIDNALNQHRERQHPHPSLIEALDATRLINDYIGSSYSVEDVMLMMENNPATVEFMLNWRDQSSKKIRKLASRN